MRVSAVRAADRTDTDTRGEADSAEISTQGSSALESDQLPSSGRDGDTLCFFFFSSTKPLCFPPPWTKRSPWILHSHHGQTRKHGRATAPLGTVHTGGERTKEGARLVCLTAI